MTLGLGAIPRFEQFLSGVTGKNACDRTALSCTAIRLRAIGSERRSQTEDDTTLMRWLMEALA
ncbi:hypothetical protein C7293_23815 [filamentous cyanobacterium CCT1]|nr:hypothetical protein C7293_23815 [filamentous cyanobacterium CCT1]PSN81153.1 hypothetical protein C8B47_02685 [filamentous cyanobacterium CCP4]